MNNMKINGVKVICTDGSEILLNIDLVPIHKRSAAAIVSITTDRVNKELSIDTLELPSNYNGIPITRITSIYSEEFIQSE